MYFFMKKKIFVYLKQLESEEFWIAESIFLCLLVIIIIHSRGNKNRDIKTDTAIFKRVTREQKPFLSVQKIAGHSSSSCKCCPYL